MTVENIHGREILLNLIRSKIPIHAVIIEHNSKLSENTRNYLKNDFYNPKSFSELFLYDFKRHSVSAKSMETP